VDEKFLESGREEPRPEFVAALRTRLDRVKSEPTASRTGFRLKPGLAFAGGALTLATAALIAFPSVRVSAEAFLDLFRVRNFEAVGFDPKRFDKLKELGENKELMVFDRTGEAEHPPAPQVYPTPAAAGAAAGLVVREAGYLPGGFALDTVMVEPGGRVQLVVHTAKLRSLLDALDLTDVQIPTGLDGQTVTVDRPPVVIQRYKRGRTEIALVQAKSPEVALPAGVDLERLGVIGLRILGLDASEARRVAASIDWHSTLVIPVPLDASSFRRVTVNGNPGLLVTCRGDATAGSGRSREGTIVLWTEGDRVFGLTSPLGGPELIQVAESVR